MILERVPLLVNKAKKALKNKKLKEYLISLNTNNLDLLENYLANNLYTNQDLAILMNIYDIKLDNININTNENVKKRK
jgi:hypothetical protein